MKKIDELKKLSFEQALERLEDIVSKMEGGEVPLEQMIDYFEEGKCLKSLCEKKLFDLEKKVEVLVKDDGKGGNWEDFDVDNPRAVSVETTNQPQSIIEDDDEEDMLF
jgi:exodeoxyribonuclease VII small subunit